MSSCAASRVIYFLLFHNPFHNHNVHTSATSLLAPPTSSSPAHTCTHLHTPALYSTATAQRLSIALPPTPEMISDHALADLANGLGIAAMAFIVLYHFVAVNGKRMEA
ncbi:hypothetical protein AYX15_03127 [Cryptococcus neoformans]|nr:hypothetical protein AYX15_03127 [Cryptococcus neoformans var. grubii]